MSGMREARNCSTKQKNSLKLRARSLEQVGMCSGSRKIDMRVRFQMPSAKLRVKLLVKIFVTCLF